MIKEEENNSKLEDPQKILDDLLEESKYQGRSLVEHGHNLTETGQYIFDLSSAVQNVIKTEIYSVDIEPLIHDWELSNDHMGITLSHLGKIDLPAVYSTTGTMTVSSGAIFSQGLVGLRTIAPKSDEFEDAVINLNNVISRYSNEDEVLNLLSEMDFDQKIGDNDSPKVKFRFAHEAYKKPITSDNPAITSLIPMREAIRGVIDQLLKRRPTQEKAKNEHDKILSIGSQLKRDSISIGLVEAWAQQWIVILNHLSQAKEKNISRAEWLHQLRQATIFLKNLLNGLDPSKFRK